MNKTSYVVGAGVALLLLGGLYYFIKEEPLLTPIPTQAVNLQERLAGLTYIGNTIFEEQNGKRVWEFNAENIEIDPDTKNVKIKNMKGVFYRENGEKIDITAPEAFIQYTTQDVEMLGDVQAISSDGAIFTAHKVRWAGKEQRFYGSEGIIFKREDAVLTGDTLESDLNMAKITVKGNARVVKGGSLQ